MTDKRTLRGGSFLSWWYVLRTSARHGYNPDSRDDYVGFRLVRKPKQKARFKPVLGGSWSNEPHWLRIAAGNWCAPAYPSYFVGFRIVRRYI